MKAAIQLVERLGATVVGEYRDKPLWGAALSVDVLSFSLHAGVAAVAIENTEGGKWVKENYKFSHCIPEELQSQIDQKYLNSFKGFDQ